MAGSRTVALVTLGCARNEVDSEGWPAVSRPSGWTLVDDAADADVAVVNTCGFVEQAKKDSIDTVLRPERGPAGTRAVVAVGCLAERYGAQLAAELPEADAVLGFDSYADMSAHLDAILRGERPRSHVPVDRRTLLPLSPSTGRESVVARAGRHRRTAGRGPAGGGRPGQRSSRRAPPAGRPALGAAQARVRLRPALHLLRHPVVPRRVRLAAAGRRPGRGPVAGGPGRPRAGPGQRELDVLRQGPRRPAPARDAAARAGRGRRHRAGAGVLPAAGRDAPRPGRGDRHHAGRRAVLRPVLPARVRAVAAPDAPLRRPRVVPRAAGPDPLPLATPASART